MTDPTKSNALASYCTENEGTPFCEGVETYEKNGHHVTLPYTSVIEFKDGKMYRQRDYFDARTIEVQLGMTPPPTSPRKQGVE